MYTSQSASPPLCAQKEYVMFLPNVTQASKLSLQHKLKQNTSIERTKTHNN